jgi:hypothetical protein
VTVTQRLMAPGSFRLGFTKEARSLLEQIQLLDHVLITPTQLPEFAVNDSSVILQAARQGGYTGVVTGKPNARSIVGFDPSWWMGSADGVGPYVPRYTMDGTLSDWLTNILPNNGISIGTVTSPGGSKTGVIGGGVTVREALDEICQVWGVEWRMRPDFTVDVAPAATLFTWTPNVIVTRGPGGIEDGLRGVQGSVFGTSRSADGVSSEVRVFGAGEGASTVQETATTTPSGVRWVSPGGTTPSMVRAVDAPSADAAQAADKATATLNLFSSARREVSVSSTTYAPARLVAPGDRVWGWDPESGLLNLNNDVRWRGAIVMPEMLRLTGLTWGVESGMGVVARLSTSPVRWIDLTPFVEWEDPEAWWEVSTVAGAQASGTPRWQQLPPEAVR